MVKQIILVGAGGAVGSILRFLTSVYIARVELYSFPVATFVVNMLGCFIIGLFVNLIPENNLRFLLITGFCGGFTTFSTFATENIVLFENNQILLAIVYTILSCLLGFGAVALGMYLTR